jgi:hypothetical protein
MLSPQVGQSALLNHSLLLSNHHFRASSAITKTLVIYSTLQKCILFILLTERFRTPKIHAGQLNSIESMKMVGAMDKRVCPPDRLRRAHGEYSKYMGKQAQAAVLCAASVATAPRSRSRKAAAFCE